MWPSISNPFFDSLNSLQTQYAILITFVCCGLFGTIAVKKKWLTANAIVATSLIALVITYKVGLLLLLYPFLFALIGSKLSYTQDNQKEKNGRTAKQVLANAGVAFIAIVFLPSEQTIAAIIIYVFSIALADTMSSEIGKRQNSPTIDICTLKKVEPGLSGGISTRGTLAGILGATIIAVAAMLYCIDIRFFISVLLVGIIGMFLDSVIGSIAQGKYLMNNKISETGNKEMLAKGFHLIDNDATNFLSILIVILSLLFLNPPY